MFPVLAKPNLVKPVLKNRSQESSAISTLTQSNLLTPCSLYETNEAIFKQFCEEMVKIVKIDTFSWWQICEFETYWETNWILFRMDFVNVFAKSWHSTGRDLFWRNHLRGEWKNILKKKWRKRNILKLWDIKPQGLFHPNRCNLHFKMKQKLVISAKSLEFYNVFSQLNSTPGQDSIRRGKY